MPEELDLLDPFRKRKSPANWMNAFFEPIKLPLGMQIRSPLVDIADKGKFLQVKAELPGIEKKDIDLNIAESSLSIRAAAKAEKKEGKKEKGYYYHERAFQSFFRQLALPSEVLPEKAKAGFHNGVLTIDLPKKFSVKELKKPRKIMVK